MNTQEDITSAAKLRQGQQTLTPEYAVAYADIPATPPSGGDFHDAFVLDAEAGEKSPVAVIIGDVAGHGPEQALQAEHMRELLSDCLSVGLTPAQTLSAVNAMIEPDPNFEGFGTVFVGTLEAGTGKLVYASGGHEPALITPAEAAGPDAVQELDGTGPPVGAFPPSMTRFEQHQATIPPGGTLLLYTDGVSDAPPSPVAFGMAWPAPHQSNPRGACCSAAPPPRHSPSAPSRRLLPWPLLR